MITIIGKTIRYITEVDCFPFCFEIATPPTHNLYMCGDYKALLNQDNNNDDDEKDNYRAR